MRQVFYDKIVKKRYAEKLYYIINILLAYMLWFFVKKRYLNRYGNSYLIGAEDDRFENNCRAMWLYLYEQENKNVFWVARRKNWMQLKENGVVQLVKRGSLHNYLIALSAKAALYSHSDYDIAPGIFRIMKHRKAVLVHINHGQEGIKVIAEDSFSSMPVDLLCAVSEYEKDIKVKKCGAKEDAVKVTGLARHDYFSIQKEKVPITKILFMPTWRDNYLNGTYDFYQTELYKNYDRLFRNPEFIRWVSQNHITCTFVLHPKFEQYYGQSLKGLFEGCPFLKVILNMGNVQKEIVESGLLVTDYSSLSWDYIYMNKPVIFYWFDYDEYRKKRDLYVTKESFGEDVVEKEEDLIIKIQKCVMDKNVCASYKDQYFTYNDKNNCQRIGEEIQKMVDKRGKN